MAGKPLKQDNTGVVTSVGGNLPRYENNSAETRQHQRAAAQEQAKKDIKEDPQKIISQLRADLEAVTRKAEEFAITVKEQTEKIKTLNEQLKKLKKQKAKGVKMDKTFGTDKQEDDSKIEVGELKNPPATAKPIEKKKKVEEKPKDPEKDTKKDNEEEEEEDCDDQSGD